MDQLNGFLNHLLAKPRFEEDFVDRLNYKVTGIIFLGFSILLSLKSYVGKPIQCWMPAQFKGGWDEYVEDYCFVENTYWLPMEQRIPDDPVTRDEKMISYYQWVPFVLAIQALMFNLPHILWRSLNWIAGINVRAVIEMATKPGMAQDGITTTVTMVAEHIKNGINIQPAVSRTSNPFGWLLRWGCTAQSLFITTFYLFVKLLFVANLLLQFLILRSFLGTDYNYWGAQVLSDLAKGKEWETNNHFPRVTLCDFQVRQLGNLHRWSVQCVLMINMFNEKIYLFLWWWLMLVSVLTIVSFIYWLLVSLIGGLKKEFILRMLSAQGLEETLVRSHVDRFMSKTLKTDGVFVLRLMSKNAGDIVSSQVVAQLFQDYCKEHVTGPAPRPLSMDQPSEPNGPMNEKSPSPVAV